ncbi:hypothetical protein [Mycobacterium antarcticum]|uniref:hypothetical protein n=1 Tax=unclassified Mycolicibacterium TaxID=2636767 RepID=UPI0024E0FFA3|nr:MULTISPECIES: hypothetical protein [unclassified Mycolicibacterium]
MIVWLGESETPLVEGCGSGDGAEAEADDPWFETLLTLVIGRVLEATASCCAAPSSPAV